MFLFVIHDDVIKWKHFPRNWPFVRGIHRSPVNSPHKGQWRVALMFSFAINMMTSSNGSIFRVTGHLCGEFTGPGEFPTQRPVTRSFDVYFDLCPNKWLSKQSWGWWFETLSCSLWCHRNATPVLLWALHNALAQFQDYASWSWALLKRPCVLQPELNPGIFQ